MVMSLNRPKTESDQSEEKTDCPEKTDGPEKSDGPEKHANETVEAPASPAQWVYHSVNYG